MRKTIIQNIFAALFILLSTLGAQAVELPKLNTLDIGSLGERILDFHSDITVGQDNSMEVDEKITVVALNQNINHGIYRDFPTRYTDKYGNTHNVGFKIESVLRNGKEEPYHTERMSNGVRVYFGSADVTLEPSIYSYEFIYHTDRQVGYFADHDELYWNVTGNGWVFPIDQVSASIYLPNNLSPESLKAYGYTGAFGSKASDLVANIADNGATYESTKQMSIREGMTVVLEFPKGIVHEPTKWEYFVYFIKDNYVLGIDLIMVLLLAIYFYRTWSKYGRDPKSRTIIAQYEAPRGLSPATIRHVLKMGVDSNILPPVIIGLAVKGYLKISDNTDSGYILTKTPNTDQTKLSGEENAFLTVVFAQSDSYTIQKKFSETMLEAKSVVMNDLKLGVGEKYFVYNGTQILKCIALSILVIMVGFVLQKIQSTSLGGPILCGAVILLNAIFIFLLPKYTELGRDVLDEIYGLKLFMTVTEKDRMNFHNPPEKTPELFEKFLPYALALGVENKWAKQFEKLFADMYGENGYSPSWYHGAMIGHSLSGFTDNLSSNMGSVISSSSTVPGSSSGSGGSSGGGGGGGGGGGW
jgi:uncharacterized membrane protein YgcG